MILLSLTLFFQFLSRQHSAYVCKGGPFGQGRAGPAPVYKVYIIQNNSNLIYLLFNLKCGL